MMPSLLNTLPQNDLEFLRIVSQLWGVELQSTQPSHAMEELVEALCDAVTLEEVVSTLTDDARDALGALFAAGGRLPWAAFSRRFGTVREMGPGKRDREKPHLRPASPAEILFYRALLARAFFDTPSGPQEFAFIPDDLFEALGFIEFEPPASAPTPEAELEPEPEPPAPANALPEPQYEDLTEFDIETDADKTEADEDDGAMEARETGEEPAAAPEAIQTWATPPRPTPTPQSENAAPGRAATPNERAHPIPASDVILDDATTLLAALRSGLPAPATTATPADFIRAVLLAAGILRDSAPQPEAAKAFLEAPRPAALEQLSQAWQSSEINDLRQTPGLICEGAWSNDPLVTREFLLDLLGSLPEGVWWSLPAFIRDIKARYPDFQRPAGNFDAWLIRRQADGESLRGFAHWDEVDGALIRYIITGPLHWLGEVDLAAPADNGPVTAFRLANLPPKREEKGKISVSSNGSIAVPRDAARAVRYLVARFCAWEPEKAGAYRYRVTPASLKRAREQGLKVEHLLALLAKHSEGAVPPVFIKALNRWEAKGSEARIETLTVIKVASPEILNELRQKAARFLGEVIGPTTVAVKSGAAPKVLAILNEMGFLTEEQE